MCRYSLLFSAAARVLMSRRAERGRTHTTTDDFERVKFRRRNYFVPTSKIFMVLSSAGADIQVFNFENSLSRKKYCQDFFDFLTFCIFYSSRQYLTGGRWHYGTDNGQSIAYPNKRRGLIPGRCSESREAATRPQNAPLATTATAGHHGPRTSPAGGGGVGEDGVESDQRLSVS